MASLVTYTKAMLIERLKKHISNDFPTSQFPATDNELVLYIDQAAAYGLVGQVWAAAKLEGNMVMPDGYLSTFLLPALTQDTVTAEWYSTLPQPPVGLPLGYSITNGYFANSVNGKGRSIFLIKNHRVGYREDMPMPKGVRAWVEGSKIKFAADDGGSLLGQNCYITMASTRTESLTDVMTLPDDALQQIFDNVVIKLKDRLLVPQDVIQDDLPAGNKGS